MWLLLVKFQEANIEGNTSIITNNKDKIVATIQLQYKSHV